MKKRTTVMVLIVMMTVFDYFATWLALISGAGVEVNPVAAWLFGWSLVGGMAVLGLVSIAGISIVWFNVRQRFVYHAAIFLCGFKAAVMVYHILGLIATGGIA